MLTTLQSEDSRVSRLLKQMAIILETLEQLTQPIPGEVNADYVTQSGASGVNYISRTLCRDLYRIRRLRDSILGADMFNDHAWDMMLDLYQAELDGADVPVVSLCAAALIPQTSGLRIISALVERGLVQKRVDSADRRRCFVTLTVQGHRAMAEFVNRVIASRADEQKDA
ncbi:winged helix DNA-binding protein [Sphingomonas zeae]